MNIKFYKTSEILDSVHLFPKNLYKIKVKNFIHNNLHATFKKIITKNASCEEY